MTNDVFAKNAWFFRNALVRANFKFIRKGIYDDKKYIIMFLRNLLLNEHNILRNRDLRISIDSNDNETTPRETRVLELIKANPRISIDELASRIGVSPRTIDSVIALLSKENKIKRINGKRFGHWEIL